MQQEIELPDFEISEASQLCSAAQLETLHRMESMRWIASHLWEKSPGEVVIWCIARMSNNGKDFWSHGWVDTAGVLHRYENKIKIQFNTRSSKG